MNNTMTIQQLIDTLTKAGEKIGDFDTLVYFDDDVEIESVRVNIVYDTDGLNLVHVSLND